MGRKKKAAKPNRARGRAFQVESAGEAQFVQRALAAYRESRRRLHEARDPVASKAAYEGVWEAMDAMGQELIETVEAEEGDEEPDEFSDELGRWKRVTDDPCTYHTLRGSVRVRRGRYRCIGVRNGPTRCPFEERRGVMSRSTMPDLGEAILRAYADVPADEAAKLLHQMTRHSVPSARIKRVFVEEATRLKKLEDEMFESLFRRDPVPASARSVIVSVDALSLLLREEGWKQATVATLTLLDADGEAVGNAWRPHTIRLAEMPEAGKTRIMDLVEREVRALLEARPDLEVVVVIDGASDLRAHLLERFPDARHLVDFFHVVEHLAGALRLLFPEDEERRTTERAKWCHRLKHKQGTPWRMWRWLRDEMERTEDPLSPWAKREVEKHAEYIYNQRPWMKYPQAIEDHVAIGSGRVEAACKTLVTQRLKVSGASWKRPGAEGQLFIRSLLQSGRFERAFSYALTHREVLRERPKARPFAQTTASGRPFARRALAA